ncbi:MAG: copper amine oxidase N-terminal domain-containing protein [Syntrophomonas sp.]
MRKFTYLLWACLLIFCFMPEAAASPRLIVDGQLLNCDVAPYIEEDRTMVPASALFQALGADVSWDPETETIDVQKGINLLKLTVGQAAAMYNEDIITFDAPVQIIDSRAMVPLNLAAEVFNAKVNWVNLNEDNQIIVVRNPIIASKVGLNNDTFRNTRWGQSMNEVVQAEGSPPLYSTEGSLVYFDVYFNEIPCDLGYYFLNDSLILGFYDLHGEKLEGSAKIDRFNYLGDTLSGSYGAPVVVMQNWSNPESWYLDDIASAIEAGDVELFNAWFDEYSIICLFLGKNGSNLGMVCADIDQLDNALASLFGY